MDVQLIYQGFVIGFTAAAAVGPIAMLCVQRTLTRGWKYGWVSGLGVGTADAVYGLIGGLGLTALTSFLVTQQDLLRLLGGMVLIYMGVKILFSVPNLTPAKNTSNKAAGYFGAFTSILLLTFSNPITILYFVAVYAGLGLRGGTPSAQDALLFALGVFWGSVFWWTVLVSGVTGLRKRFQPEMLAGLNKLTGAVIAGFGVIILVNLAL